MRLLGMATPPVAWEEAPQALAHGKPERVLVLADNPLQVRRCLEMLQDRPPQQRWMAVLPAGLGAGQEHMLKDAGADLVSEPVLIRSTWQALAQVLIRRERDRQQVALTGHVLVAEDNLVNQKVIQSMLKKLGLTSHVVENGKQAVAAAIDQRSRYSMILMDCEMPDMDGYQAATEIRRIERERDWARLPIVALSAHVMSDHLEAVRQADMDEALAKPINLDTLRECLSRHLS
jgi:CheY-like chemotaxis protein